ncbi:MAG: hypothetical protein ACJ754_03905 [Pyrinomonadaceae bacterium]
MSRRSDEGVLLRDYLLGKLDEAAREQIEERLLDDDGFEASLSAAQDALIDDYVFDALPAAERESFDQNFVVNDERRRKLLFAHALKVYVEERGGQQGPPARRASPHAPPPKKPLPFFRAHKTRAAVSAFILLLLLLVPAAVWWLRRPDEAALLREQRGQLAAEFNRRPADESIQALRASELNLQPMLREESLIPRATLTDDIRRLTLKLTPPEGRHDDYKATVLPVGGEELFTVRGLTQQLDAGRATITLNIPTELLSTGDYEIQLRAGTDDDRSPEPKRYYFRVIGKK